MNNKCIVCGKEATTQSEIKSVKGSILTITLCERHEKARLLGKRRVKKAIRKGLRGAF